jgi:hypothetical protein
MHRAATVPIYLQGLHGRIVLEPDGLRVLISMTDVCRPDRLRPACTDVAERAVEPHVELARGGRPGRARHAYGDARPDHGWCAGRPLLLRGGARRDDGGAWRPKDRRGAKPAAPGLGAHVRGTRGLRPMFDVEQPRAVRGLAPRHEVGQRLRPPPTFHVEHQSSFDVGSPRPSLQRSRVTANCRRGPSNFASVITATPAGWSLPRRCRANSAAAFP